MISTSGSIVFSSSPTLLYCKAMIISQYMYVLTNKINYTVPESTNELLIHDQVIYHSWRKWGPWLPVNF